MWGSLQPARYSLYGGSFGATSGPYMTTAALPATPMVGAVSAPVYNTAPMVQATPVVMGMTSPSYNLPPTVSSIPAPPSRKFRPPTESDWSDEQTTMRSRKLMTTRTSKLPDNCLELSFTALLLAPICGVIALWYSCAAMTHNDNGDYYKAKKSGRRAMWLSILGIIITLIIVIIIIILLLTNPDLFPSVGNNPLIDDGIVPTIPDCDLCDEDSPCYVPYLCINPPGEETCDFCSDTSICHNQHLCDNHCDFCAESSQCYSATVCPNFNFPDRTYRCDPCDQTAECYSPFVCGI